MKHSCPEVFQTRFRPLCPFPGCVSLFTGPKKSPIVRFGSFRRSSDSRRVQRFRCLSCRRSFSRATLHPWFRQKKRRLNHKLLLLQASSVTHRRASLLLGCSRSTVARKLRSLAQESARHEESRVSKCCRPLAQIQFDELETFEHTKMKPLSVAIAVDAITRKILGIQVARMPAKGLLSERARRKYGPRPDERQAALRRLLVEIEPWVGESTDFKTELKSDSHPYYAPLVKAKYPNHLHSQVLSRKGCVTGQGELKRGGQDPIFSLNHTCAMLRANLSRLVRRTWATTKKPEGLRHHLALYRRVHNEVLTERGGSFNRLRGQLAQATERRLFPNKRRSSAARSQPPRSAAAR